MFPTTRPGWPPVLALLACIAFPAVAATPPVRTNPDVSPESPLGPSYLGTFAGEAAVSAGGNASYTLPLQLPPGSNGMAPQLSLNYNSNMKNGMLGLGWFLQGANSAITRCPQTLSQDGQIRAIDFSETDRYCLDGNRLLAIQGAYGADGTEYRTEIDSFSRIISHDRTVSGPTSFTVETKGGLTHTYGGRHYSRIQASGRGDVRVWALDHTEDSAGNYLSIEYYEGSVTREYYPTRVLYTGNDTAGLAPYAEVVLTYEDRHDNETRYVAGSEYPAHPKRLDGIEAYSDGVLVYQYHLDYEEVGVDLRSRLTSIRQCDGNSVCRQPIELAWWSDDISFESYDLSLGPVNGEAMTWTLPRWHDFNGDGSPDYIRSLRDSLGAGAGSYNQFEIALSSADGYQTQIWNMDFAGRPRDFIWADINGDGRVDVVLKTTAGSSTTYKVALATDTGFDSRTWTGHTRSSWSEGEAYYLRDMNGDRLLDLVAQERSTDNSGYFYDCSNNYLPRYKNSYTYYVHLNNGSNFGPKQRWLNNKEEAQLAGDFNGDGLEDIIEDTRYVRLNTGSGFGARMDWGSRGDYNCYTAHFTANYQDYNGDGLSDRLAQGQVQLNNGTAFRSAGYPAISPMVNFDGNSFGDSYGRSHDAYSGYTSISLDLSGDDHGGSYHTAHHESVFGYNRFQQATDINGDGLQDYTASHTYVCDPGTGHGHYTAKWCESGTVRVWENQGSNYHLLKRVSSGLGHYTEFTYKPLTDHSVYEKLDTSTQPEMDIQDSTHVVSQISRSNGLGGESVIEYIYRGLKRDLGGRGNLGFWKISATDQGRGTVTHTRYAQTFPYSMRPIISRTRRLDDNLLLKRSTTSYAVHESTPTGPVFPYVETHLEEVFDPADGRLLSTLTTQNHCDDYGNITQTTTTTDDMENGGSHRSLIENSYNIDTDRWRIAQLTARSERLWLNDINNPSLDRHTEFGYDPATGFLLNTTQEKGRGSDVELTRTISYDLFGNAITETINGPGINPGTSSVEFDDQGQFAVTLTNALGHQVRQTWDDRFGVKLSETDPNGQLTTWTYDSFGRLASEARPDGSSTHLEAYEERSGNHGFASAYRETLASGQAPIREFVDLLGRTVRVRTQGFQGNYVHQDTQYDTLGRPYRVSEPYFDGDTVHWNTASYDLLGREVGLQAADPIKSTQTTYDGFSSWITDSRGRTISRTVDALGKVIEVIDKKGTVMHFAYDAAGNRTQVRNAVGTPLENTVSYNFDRLGRLLSQDDPDHGLYRYSYDALGKKLSEVSPKLDKSGQQTTWTYDELGRVTGRDEPAGVTTWSYDNDKNGNLGIGRLDQESKDDFSRTFTYAATGYGQLTGATTVIAGTSYTTQQTFDLHGRVATESYPASPGSGNGFTVMYAYNTTGKLERVQSPDANAVYYQLMNTDAAGRITEEWLGDGSWLSQSYDGISARVTSQHTVNGTESIQHFSYAYDDAGNMLSRSDLINDLEESFSFDSLDRLTSAQVGGQEATDYAFDATGNITRKSDKGTDYVYTSAAVHAVTQVRNGASTATMSYNDNGNFRNGGNAPTISWSSYNKPVSISKGGNSYEFNYGPDRKRYRKVHNGVETDYVGGSFEQIRHATSTEYRHVIRANGRAIMLRKHQAGVVSHEYIHRDHLGSVTALTRESDGSVIERYAYDAWGQRRSPVDWVFPVTSSDEHRGYTGHEHLDDVGIIHMNGRIYSPSLGRMLSPDPVTQAPENGQNYNRYTYAYNNPIKFSDPSGFEVQVSEAENALEDQYRVDLYWGGDWGSYLDAKKPSTRSFRYQQWTAVEFYDGRLNTSPRSGSGDKTSKAGDPIKSSSPAGNSIRSSAIALMSVESFAKIWRITRSTNREEILNPSKDNRNLPIGSVIRGGVGEPYRRGPSHRGVPHGLDMYVTHGGRPGTQLGWPRLGNIENATAIIISTPKWWKQPQAQRKFDWNELAIESGAPVFVTVTKTNDTYVYTGNGDPILWTP